MSSTSSLPALPWEIAAWYHQRTKHHFHRYANSLGYMDWATQPCPFRRYDGTRLTPLPVPTSERSIPFEHVYRRGCTSPRPIDLASLSELFFFSMAISAWKQDGENRWALRVNPSSGNLHPTEGYLILPPVNGLDAAPGLFHYAAKEHGLEHRARLLTDNWTCLAERFGPGAFFIGLSSIPWRESWKYGERAYRYCQHDVGHALGAIRLAAGLLGWRATLLTTVPDESLRGLLGLDRSDEFPEQEPEVPDLLAVIRPDQGVTSLTNIPLGVEVLRARAGAEWFGRPNRLSKNHQTWDVIDFVEDACRQQSDDPMAGLKRGVEPKEISAMPAAANDGTGCGRSADFIIRSRRSALALDGRTRIDATKFYAILDRLLPTVTAVPWDCLPWRPLVHLGLFVHRVDGIPNGLYAFARDTAAVDRLRSNLRSSFSWIKPPDCPPHMPLYLLTEGETQRVATQVSCHQDIAGNGAFSLGMLAEFEPVLRENGAHWYRRLFWEAGIVGQVLYLEAEAAGIRSTGIGCFFDEPVHGLFGIEAMSYQSLYHFTVGGPVEDPRLTTLPAYG